MNGRPWVVEPIGADRVVFRYSRYLAYEIFQAVLPDGLDRFDARFRGLMAWTQTPDSLGGWREDAPPFRSPEVTETPISSVEQALDAVFFDYLELDRMSDPAGLHQKLNERDLSAFLVRFFPKIGQTPDSLERLQGVIRTLCRELGDLIGGEPPGLGFLPEPGTIPGGPVLFSHSPVFQEVLETASRAAWSTAPILLSGENGTGKEVVARFIHQESRRADGPFVPVNCGALPDELLESELFGHKKGAFTGATRDKPGLVTTAERGTLFLDEIGELPARLQVKLLRFLQDRSFLPLGALKPQTADIRILAATNQDLDQTMADGRFRRDLYYRLSVFHLALPPLRERSMDLPALVDHFIGRFNQENRTTVTGVTLAAMKRLQGHAWPGNVRELENVVQRAVILAIRGGIEPAHLPPGWSEPSPPAGSERLGQAGAVDETALTLAIEAALDQAENGEGSRRRLGQSIPRPVLIRFFMETKGRPFPPRDLADYIAGPGSPVRRDKLAHNLIGALVQSRVLRHLGGRSQATRYELDPRFLKRE